MKITAQEWSALDRIVRLAEVTVKVWDLTDMARTETAIARSVVDRLDAEIRDRAA